MIHCPRCEAIVDVERVRCRACGLSYDGRFHLPRLARLEPEAQQLVEQIVLAAGNLKDVAAGLEISYPTLRKRLDGLILALRDLRREDREQTAALLDAVEAGEIAAEEAARLIKELNGDA